MKKEIDINDLPNDFAEQLCRRVGINVKRLREANGMSQLQLAIAIGYKSVSPVSSGEIYYRKIHFNIEHLGKIAHVLDVEISEFFK